MPPDPRVHIGAVAVLRHPGGKRVATVTRGPNATHGAGTVSLPGGWVDYGETPLEAAVRELREEIGVLIPIGSRPRYIGHTADTHEGEGLHVITMFFLMPMGTGIDIRNMEPEKAAAVGFMDQEEMRGRQLFLPLRTFTETYGWNVLTDYYD